MKLVQGPELLAELKGLCATSENVRMAVAFWGDGAADALGINEGAAGLSIVCNLRMGGTNPREIRRLIDLGATVKHSDILHAKIYLFDEAGAVGSSNASSNGLSLQGNEVGGWLEANVMFGPGALYAQASDMFEDVWTAAKKVTDPDLAKAQIAWDRRRRAGTGAIRPGVDTILKVLREQPEALTGRDVYITLDFQDMSKTAERALAKARRETGLAEKLSGWENWSDMPDSSDFICFVSRDGVIQFDQMWKSPDKRHEVTFGKSGNIGLIYRSENVQNFEKPGPITEWRKIFRRIIKERGRDNIFCIEAGEFARQYLAEPSPFSP